jgi:prolyl oligopeptidase
MPLRCATEEIVHGTVVRDPYRWLEDRTLPETVDWIRTEQRRCSEYFAACPGLGVIERRVGHYLDVEIIDQPACIRDRYFYRKRPPGQEQGSICVCRASGGGERELVNPSQNGPFTSVGIYRISSDAAFLAFEQKRNGGDRREIHFLDVNRGAILPNTIPLGYASGLAFSDSGYFFCHEIDQSSDEHTICYESFGSARQARTIFRVPRASNSRLILRASERWLGALRLRYEGRDIVTDFWVRELRDDVADWTSVFRGRRGLSSPILWRDRILVLIETRSGSSQLITVSPRGEELGVFVPEKKAPLRQIGLTRDRIFVAYVEYGASAIDAWTYSGQQTDSVPLPHGGTVRMLSSPAEETESLFYTFESFELPPAIYQHQTTTNKSLLWHQRGPIDPSRCRQVHEATILSKDGERIPLTLVSAGCKGMPIGLRPALMTSYGGFGAATTPQFSALASILIEFGAVLALPHVRGGGEFGKAWHDAGRARNRQTSFDDFIVAAEWLCDQRVTTPARLGIFGGSNSGLLVAAAMTQRPELFGAMLCIAPLLDMVRYESCDKAAKWRREYGTVEDEEDFRALYAYSPYHHIAEDVDYPPVLFVTGDEDDRCNPAHVRKMAARLLQRSAQRSAVIVDYSQERGHSPVLPLSVRIRALARRIAFLCRELRITVPEGGFDGTPRP